MHVGRLVESRESSSLMNSSAGGGSFEVNLRSSVSGRVMSGNFRPANLRGVGVKGRLRKGIRAGVKCDGILFISAGAAVDLWLS